MPELGTIARGIEIGKGNSERRRRQKYIWVQCPDCKKERWTAFINGKVKALRCRPYANRLRAYKYPMQGENSPAWKGGKRMDIKGYIWVKIFPDNFFYPMAHINGYILEHRLIVAQHLERCLALWELVHHKDGNKSNNAYSNLELTTGGAHSLAHNKGYQDGYQQGLQDGKDKQLEQLQLQVKLLSWHILELEKKLDKEQNGVNF